MQSLRKIEASKFANASILQFVDFILVDSTVEATSTDTTTRVRFVRATTAAQSTYEATETQTRTDTASASVVETEINPIAVQSIKDGDTGLRPHVRRVLNIIFFIIAAIFVAYVKKSLPLRR